ncbi:MAG: site-specific recombinase XerD [Frankiales bacterium]|nr:site-specific recombinase XerD [Frankiales bacterium]
MRGHVAQRCPQPAAGEPPCPAQRCGHPWSIWWDAPRTPDGRRRQRTRGGFPTRKEAERALREELLHVDNGTALAPERTTVGDYLATWVTGIDRKPATLSTYRRIVRAHLVPQLGAVRLQALTVPQIRAAYRALLDEGGLSPATVQLCHQVLSKALSDACDDGLLRDNPAIKVKAPSRRTPEMRTWTRDQAVTFLAHVQGERLAAMWRLFLTTGMRRGEVAALRWQDVDLDRAFLSVRQTGNMIEGRWVVGTPKGRGDATAKTRRLSLDALTVEALRRHRAAQLQERSAAGALWADEGLVFCREDGLPLHPSSIGQRLRVRARHAGLPHVRVHDLRHTYATLALEAGIHPKVVSEWLGHANIGITLNLYSHVSEGMDREAADVVAALFS